MNWEGEEGNSLGVVLPDLSGTLFEAESSENGDAGVHHVDLTKVLHFHS